MDTENFHEQTKPDEATPESGMEVEEDDAQEIVVDELKEKSEQCFDTLDETHFVHEVNANNVMIEDEDSKGILLFFTLMYRFVKMFNYNRYMLVRIVCLLLIN